MNTTSQQELNSCLLTIYIAIGLSDGSLGTNEGKTILAKAKQLYENTSMAEAEFNRIKNHLELLSVQEIWEFLSAKIEASVHKPLLRKELQNSSTTKGNQLVLPFSQQTRTHHSKGRKI
jgi:DNA-binding PadR family transcriptional regulator